MIHIKESDKEIKIPKHLNTGDTFSVILIQGQQTTTLCEEQISKENLEFFYVFNINNYPNNIGEYEYNVISDGTIVEKGLLVYGNYNKEQTHSIDIKEKNIQVKHKIY